MRWVWIPTFHIVELIHVHKFRNCFAVSEPCSCYCCWYLPWRNVLSLRNNLSFSVITIHLFQSVSYLQCFFGNNLYLCQDGQCNRNSIRWHICQQNTKTHWKLEWISAQVFTLVIIKVTPLLSQPRQYHTNKLTTHFR